MMFFGILAAVACGTESAPERADAPETVHPQDETKPRAAASDGSAADPSLEAAKASAPGRGASHGLDPCYTAALERNPRATGRVLVSWEVVAERPTKVEATENTTGDPRFADCVVAAVRGWPFRGAPGGPGSLPVMISPAP